MKKWFGILIAVVCLVGFSMPAYAAHEAISDHWSVEGQVGLFTAYAMSDSAAAGYEDTSELSWYTWDMMYIGFNYKSDKVKATIDLKGQEDQTATFDKAVGEVDFGSWQFAAGRTDPLTFNPVGTPPGKYANFGLGVSIGGTTDKLVAIATIPMGKGKLQFMLGDPNTNFMDKSGGDAEVKIPAIEAKFSAFTGFPWAIYGGYQTVDDATAGGSSVNSYLIGAVVRPKLGPVNFNFAVNYDTNMYIAQGYPGQFTPNFAGTYAGAPGGPGAWNYSADENTTMLGAIGTGLWNFSKTFGIGFGLGYQKFDAGEGFEDTNMMYYINFPWYVHPQFRIMPYYAKRSFDKVTLGGTEYDQANQSEIGINWRLEF